MEREKVIKGLEIQLDDLQKYADCDEILTLTQEQAKEIVALLKEQKAVKPTKSWYLNELSMAMDIYRCGNCNEEITGKGKYCSNCGKPVLWEGR